MSNEKGVRHYVDLIVKVFHENPKIKRGEGILNANLRHSRVRSA